jgi:hypothetical protein
VSGSVVMSVEGQNLPPYSVLVCLHSPATDMRVGSPLMRAAALGSWGAAHDRGNECTASASRSCPADGGVRGHQSQRQTGCHPLASEGPPGR